MVKIELNVIQGIKFLLLLHKCVTSWIKMKLSFGKNFLDFYKKNDNVSHIYVKVNVINTNMKRHYQDIHLHIFSPSFFDIESI